METIRNTAEEIMEEKAGLELAPEKMANVSGGTGNEAEEADKKKKRMSQLDTEETNHKRKP